VHAVVETAVATNWDHRRRTYEDFLADQRQRDGHDPSLWFLAEADGHPAGAGRVYARAGMDALGTADQWRRVYT
jgi:hypothetical protein